jgi:hypothetical protein
MKYGARAIISPLPFASYPSGSAWSHANLIRGESLLAGGQRQAPPGRNGLYGAYRP